MFTIDCSKAQIIKNSLLIFVADKLGMLPILKSDKFVLTTIDDGQNIEQSDVLSTISEFLASSEYSENFDVSSSGNLIKIESVDGKILEKKPETKKDLLFECIHCGFMTQYETEWRMHKLIHYI